MKRQDVQLIQAWLVVASPRWGGRTEAINMARVFLLFNELWRSNQSPWGKALESHKMKTVMGLSYFFLKMLSCYSCEV